MFWEKDITVYMYYDYIEFYTRITAVLRFYGIVSF